MEARAKLYFPALISECVVRIDDHEMIADVNWPLIAVGSGRHGNVVNEAVDKYSVPDRFGRPLQSSAKGQVAEAAHSGRSAIRGLYIDIDEWLQNLSCQPPPKNALLTYIGHVCGGAISGETIFA